MIDRRRLNHRDPVVKRHEAAAIGEFEQTIRTLGA
jgi:hypothetical protein